ncbi:uncharacterized protein LOC115695275 [Cannabis sativa]|uniref:uncharacterized protein LOC115695275 n=1 Tax=Cannabis sativa TaxID=3483 RepID=UPI0011DF26A1|nr:uncharacterized protein LOC115695275 [Cannabis sativa]
MASPISASHCPTPAMEIPDVDDLTELYMPDIELPYIGDPFTWVKNRHKADTIKERLDWCFVNDNWLTSFEQITTSHLDFYRSDHRAISVMVQQINQQPDHVLRKTQFRFEKMCLNDDEAAAIIQQNWSAQCATTSIDLFLDNMQDCTTSLQHWHAHKFGNMKQQISKVPEDIAALNNSATRTQQTMTGLRKSKSILDDLLAQEEIYWQQRSRIDWMQSGD